MQHLVDNPPQLDLLLRKAKSTLIALNIELHEEHVERSSPIALRPTSYAAANAALDGLPRASGEWRVTLFIGGLPTVSASPRREPLRRVQQTALRCGFADAT